MMLSTFFKWLAIVNAGVQLFKAYQGFVLKQGATPVTTISRQISAKKLPVTLESPILPRVRH